MNAAPAPHDVPDAPDHDLTRRLSASLHAHLDTMGAQADLASGAVARSWRIRRNHRAARVLTVAVAALAVATPIAWTSLHGGTEAPFVPAVTTSPPSTSPPGTSTTTGPPTQGPTTQGATPSTTGATRTAAPPVTAVTTADNDRPPLRSVMLSAALPAGPAPDAAWALDQTLHIGGTTFTLDVDPSWTFTELAGGASVVVDSRWDRAGTVKILRADGSTARTVVDVPAGHGVSVVADDAGTRFTVMVNDPGSKVADALITTFDASGATIATKQNLRHDVELVGIVGNRVFLANENVGRSFVWDLTTNVINRYTDSGLIRAVNGAQQLAALWTHNADFTRGCTEILDVTEAPVTVAKSCGAFVPRDFSPDGDHLVGFPIGTDGFGALKADVLDVSTGRIALRVNALTPHFAFLRDGTLGIEYVDRYGLTGTTDALVACTVDGACRRFTDQVPMADDTTHFRLPR